MGDFVEMHSVTVISMSYLVNNSKTISKNKRPVFGSESVDQAGKWKMAKFDLAINDFINVL